MKKRRNRKKYSNLAFYLMLFVLAVVFVFGNFKVNTDTEIISVGETKQEVRATWFGMDASWLIKKDGSVDLNKVGEYKIQYSLKPIGKKYERIIKVVDKESPKIQLQGEKEMIATSFENYVEPGFTAVDNYDGDITENVKTKVYKHSNSLYQIEYMVEDSSGNLSIARRDITIKAGNVYLTFDDGPSYDITPKILEVLEEKNVKATFFIVGFKESKDYLIKKEYEAGHTIGLHGYSHDYSEVYASVEALMNNFKKTRDLLKETTGYEAKFIRFPGGSSNTVSRKYCKNVMTQGVAQAAKENYIYFDWNVDSGDSGTAKTAEAVYQNVINGLMLGENNVILMHDFSNNKKTLEALPRIIDYCIENNFEIKPITEETTPVHHGIAN